MDANEFYGDVVTNDCVKGLTIIDPVIVDEQLVDDFINLAGYTTLEAYKAAEAVARFEGLN